MNKPALIGTGFFATALEHEAKQEFFGHYWMPCIGDRDVILFDNSERGMHWAELGVTVLRLRVRHNLGHVVSALGENEPHLKGWSMSWILPALMAYADQRDFIYVEQDCLVFGEWEAAILEQAKSKGLLAAFGMGTPVAPCEQSLFWIKAEAISRFVSAYMAITDGDSVMLPEHKFCMMARADSRIGTFNMGVGRGRPITPYAPAWYFQQPSAVELMLVKEKGLLA